MRHPHKWEEMLPEEFFEELERKPIVYWACGAMEEHGLHNPLAMDPYTGYEICLRAVEKSGGILFPVVPFAIAYYPGLSREELRSKKRELFPPSLWVSHELCERLYVELMESMADIGFRSCIAFGGHAPADDLLQQIEKKHNGRIGNMRFWGGGTIRILRDVLADVVKKEPLSRGHGMMWETSMALAIRQDWVDLPRAARIKSSPLPSQLKPQSDEAIAYIAKANPELGNFLINTAAERIARLAEEMLKEQ